MQKQDGDVKNRYLQYALRILLFAAIGLGAAMVILLIAAALISGGVLPLDSAYVCSVVACLCGAFGAGFLTSRAFKNRGLILGVVAGAAFFVLLIIAGLIVYARAWPQTGGVPMFAASLLGGAGGGVALSFIKKK